MNGMKLFKKEYVKKEKNVNWFNQRDRYMQKFLSNSFVDTYIRVCAWQCAYVCVCLRVCVYIYMPIVGIIQ